LKLVDDLGVLLLNMKHYMRSFWITLSLVLLFAVLAPVQSASAQDYGPGFRRRVVTVAWIIRNRDNIDADDRFVTLIGTVIRPVGEESYWFTDGTGTIRLDSEKYELPMGPRVVIGGRVDEAFLGIGHLEVDVRRWRYAPVDGKVAPGAFRQPIPQ
jgi:uncharacterized protein YdeI (BOF family)